MIGSGGNHMFSKPQCSYEKKRDRFYIRATMEENEMLFEAKNLRKRADSFLKKAEELEKRASTHVQSEMSKFDKKSDSSCSIM